MNVKTSSNVITRFISHIKAPLSSNELKWFRLKLLRTVASIERHFIKVEESISSKNEMSIPNAVYHAKDLYLIINNDLIYPVLSKLKDKKNTTSNTELEGDKHSDHLLVDLSIGVQSILKELSDIRNSLSESEDKKKYTDLVRKSQRVNEEILDENINIANALYLDLLSEYSEFKNKIEGKVINDFSIEKEANALTRWLKRKNLKYFTNIDDRQRSLRLSLIDKILILRDNLNNLMNVLEDSNVSIISIVNNIKTFINNLSGFYLDLSKLAEVHNNESKMLRYNSRMEGKKVPVDLISIMDIRELSRISSKLNSLKDELSVV